MGIDSENILKFINEFLIKKRKPEVTLDTELYSSGLLDSLEMLELVLFLETKGVIIKNKTGKLTFIMDKINTPLLIIELTNI